MKEALHTIVNIQVGSHLYGTTTSSSDRDYNRTIRSNHSAEHQRERLVFQGIRIIIDKASILSYIKCDGAFVCDDCLCRLNE